jgi:hypothetical protein
MSAMKTSWVRVVMTIAFAALAVATAGCDWANVGGPW